MAAIQFDNVCFSYADTATDDGLFSGEPSFCLEKVNLSVKEGEFVAILGHNGSGKSTLARLTNGLLSPSSGEITVFGLDAKNPKNLFNIRKQVGIVFQNPDNQTVASIVEDDIAFGPENVGLPREEIKKRIDFALKAVGMEKYRNATPTRLSGGQKQRIAIAGVLALKPKVMILDESTAMLDPRGRKEVIDVVYKLNKEEGITVILITHFPEEALLADRAVVMSKGKIVMEGTPAQIFEQGEELKRYSLNLPRPVAICRAISQKGLFVSEGMDANAVANNLVSAIQNAGEETLKKIDLTGVCTDSAVKTVESETQTGGVDAERLSYVYNAKSPFATPALKDVSLKISAGEFFGILGHTGSGKSTFVQHLNALIKVETAEKKYKEKKLKKGEVPLPRVKLVVNGFDLTDKKTDFMALRSKVGMVFQYPEQQLFAETVFDDVAFGLKNFKAGLTEEEITVAVREAITMVGLDFEQIKKRSPFELSGGQRRRVAIAGVIVTKPEILVLDEPAAGLDPLGKEEIMSLLHKLHSAWCKTVIIVSHDMDEIAENCTSAAVFADGKMLVSDTPKKIFSDAATLQAVGLDLPFTAKICNALREKGVELDCDYTCADFVQKLLAFAKTKGAGTSSTEGGGINA